MQDKITAFSDFVLETQNFFRGAIPAKREALEAWKKAKDDELRERAAWYDEMIESLEAEYKMLCEYSSRIRGQEIDNDPSPVSAEQAEAESVTTRGEDL